MILEDQIVQFENDSQPTQAPAVCEHTRPDLCVIDHATKTRLKQEPLTVARLLLPTSILLLP